MRRLLFASLSALCAQANAQDAVDFSKHVQPILAERCYECHGTKEQEGDLRLDRRDGVFGKDESKWLVRPGKPEESQLFKRITLPKNDPDVMPAEGDVLSAAQIDTIKRWIEQGANWPADAAAPAEVKPPPVEVIEVKLSADDKAAAAAAAQKLEARGAVVGPIAKDHDGLDVNLSLLRPAATDADLELVRGLGPALVWLNVSRSQITDRGLAALTGCRSLRRLHLSQTAVSDAGLAHLRGLSELRFLNLFGTAVTDQGLDHLHGLGKLEKLFLWQTKTTDSAVAALQRALPKLLIDRGGYAEQILKASAEQAAAEAKAKTEAGAALNTKCPVSGEAVDANFTLEHDGQKIAFCCGNCRAKFRAEPGKFAANLPKGDAKK